MYISSSLLQPYYSWTIDTGATYHMCSNKTLFLSLFKLSHPHFIGLTNGTNACVSFDGNVKLHDSLILQGVLYVPNFNTILFLFPNWILNSNPLFFSLINIAYRRTFRQGINSLLLSLAIRSMIFTFSIIKPFLIHCLSVFFCIQSLL